MQVIRPRSSQGLTGKKQQLGGGGVFWVEDLEFYFYLCAELRNPLLLTFK